MVVAPCSMKTLAAVAHGLSEHLLTGRRRDLEGAPPPGVAVRETPFNLAPCAT